MYGSDKVLIDNPAETTRRIEIDNEQLGDVADAERSEKVIQPEKDVLIIDEELHKFSTLEYERRKEIRRAEIEKFTSLEIHPDRVFVEIAGEWSRADNIKCGIRGEADHAILAEYISECAQDSEGMNRDVYRWIEKTARELEETRRIVKEFLLSNF